MGERGKKEGVRGVGWGVERGGEGEADALCNTMFLPVSLAQGRLEQSFFLAFMLLGQKISFDASLAQLIFTLYVSFEHNKSNIIQIKKIKCNSKTILLVLLLKKEKKCKCS